MSEITTLDGARTVLPGGALDDFRARVRGAVHEPGDPGEREVREPFNAMHPSRPAVTLRCAGTADVAAGVRFAREHGLGLAVRGGGHSIAGLSSPGGGVLLDLAPMRDVQVDPARRCAIVQGGALWADVDRETQQFGLAAPGGVVSDTGVAGLTLGGGYGWLRRKLGLSADALVEAQVVCADGEIRTASATSHPDLFWALRGGGGNFGVVTSFTFALWPVGPDVAFGAVFYPLEEIGTVLRGWRDQVTRAPDEVTSAVITMTFPAGPTVPEAVHDRPVAIVGAVHAGEVDEGMEAMAPLRRLGTPLFDMSGPHPYVEVQSGFDPLFPRDTLRAYWKSQYLDALPDAAIDVIAARALDRPAPLTLVNTFHMGGAIAATDPEATAFAQRSAPFMVSIDGLWDDPADDAARIAWVRAAWEEVKAFGNGGVYLNFTGLAGEAADAGVDTAYGRNLARLARVKAAYDPANLFRVNHNIAPA